MTESSELGVVQAYTRQALEQYLQVVAEQRDELVAAISEARARAARAEQTGRRIASLEQRVGHWIVAECARAQSPDAQPTPRTQSAGAGLAGGPSAAPEVAVSEHGPVRTSPTGSNGVLVVDPERPDLNGWSGVPVPSLNGAGSVPDHV